MLQEGVRTAGSALISVPTLSSTVEVVHVELVDRETEASITAVPKFHLVPNPEIKIVEPPNGYTWTPGGHVTLDWETPGLPAWPECHD